MEGFTVFYSWQSDLPRKLTRDVIYDAAKVAIDRVALAASLEDSPRLDHDTAGVSGVPAIGDTILGKIDACGVFLADVSLVGEITRQDKEMKRMPNPNVLLELGYAWARIGWKRLILVMNTKYGDEKELPFDLRNRRFPYGFRIKDDRSDIAQHGAELSEYIEMAIRAMVQEEHQVVTEAIKKLDGYARVFMRENSKHNLFWEAKLSGLPKATDLVILRLLQFGIIECHEFSNRPYAYAWTYLGRLCMKRLGFPDPPPLKFINKGEETPTAFSAVASVVSDMSAFDKLLAASDRRDDEPANHTIPENEQQ